MKFRKKIVTGTATAIPSGMLCAAIAKASGNPNFKPVRVRI